jgi:uncharacterized protein (DUF2126 family)/transglutaminase-like putative cysteine protease
MTLHVSLTHRTAYTYDRRIGMGPQTIRLRPAPHCRTPILAYSLTVTPQVHWLNWLQDPFGNFQARVILPEPTREFSVTVDLVADMAVINPFEFFVEEEVRSWPFKYDPALAAELKPNMEPLPATPRLDRYIRDLGLGSKVTIDFLCDLNRKLSQDVGYLIRMEPGVQTPEETLTSGSGSCRDSGWLLVHILRRLGLAARFVSGYLIQLKPDEKPLDGPGGATKDFTDLHAWAEVYVPGAGWIGLDPTSGLLAGEGHIPLAATPTPSSAAPISGGHEKAEVAFSFDMRVDRIVETPRVTKPYRDEQWQAILDAGHAVDLKLRAGDVRLSMGGEPTFVAIDDAEGAEWNTAAIGPTKRRFAEDLMRRLQARFAPGGLLHYGQGKWYPGEQLPRWSFAVYWRTDHEPLWENPAHIARENPTRPATIESADRFARQLCAQLGLAPDSAIPAYEDPAHFLLVEQKLPLNLEPGDKRLADPVERTRLVRALDTGLDTARAYVLPVQAWQTKDRGRRWVTERWALRRERLYLQPGDSPVGFRLPLSALPFVPAVDFPHVWPADPLARQIVLPSRRALMQQRRSVTLEALKPASPVAAEISGAVRTALSIEPRDGQLCVFMPPLEDAVDYAAMVGAIEAAAAEVKQPVHIEGYPPPFDARLNVIKVTPDPGVIEVNIQPATSWAQSVEITTALYEEARLARLGTEKFMLDGRHTGTQGGNHIVLGGSTPADSPFLRRPDLLASLVTYWQNHPSLSYLFSGLFIGPTSQAPRIDEGRHDNLYELEIALAQVPQPGGGAPVQPWLVDRLFRNLLIDVTGNTHRAEICIDKLYSPDGPTGRLGLVEFRSFEMPPHAQMSLAQQLLLRALIAWFWERPYRGQLVPWGTALHDRFMLGHFVWADFLNVIRDLEGAGLPVSADWFIPHRDFRFPRCGAVEHAGLTLDIRQALEPWNVLGEEGAPGGTARYVDSSVERLEVRVTGQTGDRHAITCNGYDVPLTPTGTSGEKVAGVRFRAWSPPSSLHPTIPTHAPLTFDIVDTHASRSAGGCRYHVTHPGGRGFDVFPVNAYEAEGRRLARFESMGHTPGPMTIKKLGVHRDFPLTLDLRRTASAKTSS